MNYNFHSPECNTPWVYSNKLLYVIKHSFRYASYFLITPISKLWPPLIFNSSLLTDILPSILIIHDTCYNTLMSKTIFPREFLTQIFIYIAQNFTARTLFLIHTNISELITDTRVEPILMNFITYFLSNHFATYRYLHPSYLINLWPPIAHPIITHLTDDYTIETWQWNKLEFLPFLEIS